MRVETKLRERFAIRCPVTVGIRLGRSRHSLETGELREISDRSARFYLGRALHVGTPLVLHVHFRNADRKQTTVRFDAVVTPARYAAPGEVAVRFRSPGKFLREAESWAAPLQPPAAEGLAKRGGRDRAAVARTGTENLSV